MEAARNKRPSARRRKVKDGPSQGGTTAAQPAKLSQMAEKVLNEKCKEIVDSLGKAAAEGHVQSTQLLMKLTEWQTEDREDEGVRAGAGVAAMLADEPQWPEPKAPAVEG